MSAKVTRSAAKAWLSDPATYPIIGILSFAGGMAAFAGARYLSSNPDVMLVKEKRMQTLDHHSAEQAQSFRTHRDAFAHLKPNPITKEKDYEAFSKRQH
ncbi:Aste57867_19345 [Aphanomyces stellatus]|uniref:Aste57867_16679 protein n=1 Tax=Aphanomyces stellatus TaxID=120398 RepID=A0A485LDQ1_9STRA|nr:hypothetical protein As57867_019281 [Aphanomyces stellatus]KAF0692227.1 hypothetical protein As57867_016622 [Aphanomyces stellatus]VFT93450.1 Aste57867_16679 [Aphanomyces stellatus]VFT96059.1 Aste57867_19345 [Aphanomyces stellatus]